MFSTVILLYFGMNTLISIIAALTVISGVDVRIDTRIGTEPGRSYISGKFNSESGEGEGKTIPCVTEPHGMTFWTPQTSITEKKGVPPYRYRDECFMGFRASHWLVGGATQDYGSFYVMPGTAPVPVDHDSEQAAPDYYSMSGYELTARSHSAIMHFSNTDTVTVGVINEYGEGSVEYIDGSREVTGCNPVHRIYAGWGQPAGFSGHFVLRFTNEPLSVVRSEDGRSITFTFAEGAGPIVIKAASSFVSVDGARRNLEAEIPHWDFDRTRSELAGIWEKLLGTIEVETADTDLRNQFYSSLWRASLLPRTASDVDGAYPAFGSPELNADGTLRAMKPVMRTPEGQPYYDDFSLWDTYRALHPLLNLLSPSVNGAMMQSLVLKAEQGGWLPVFPCWGSYTSAMIGYHTVSAICDAWQKGATDFNRKAAYREMRKLAFGHPSEAEYKDGRGVRALDTYERLGYLPLEEEVADAFHTREQSSRTLEYAYDDYVLSRIALRTLHLRDWWKLRRRAGNWKNVIDPRTGYVQGRHEDGTFLDDDNLLSKEKFITEGTPMHYSWYVPHDVRGLQKMMAAAGGNFKERLDSMFTEWYYWHGNEPCHQVAYLYDYTDSPQSAPKIIREILKSEYHNGPSGLSGNDDAGQMAAWFVFSTMGFYPVCPGGRARYDYALGTPCFDRLTIHLENGRDFTIVAEGTSDTDCIIGGASLNGRKYKSHFLRHKDILRGGVLNFKMCEGK